MSELRRRVLIPLVVPLVAIGVIVFVVLDFSRVLLALAGTGATVVAGSVAVVVLLGAARFSRRGPAGSPAPLLFLAGAGLTLIVGALVGLAHLDEVKNETAMAEHPGTTAAPPDVTVTAFDIGFRQQQLTVRAGEVRIAYVNEGQLVHTLVIEGAPKFRRLEVRGNGDRVIGAASFEPGTYTFYCDIPGHRQAGMVGTLTVSPPPPVIPRDEPPRSTAPPTAHGL